MTVLNMRRSWLPLLAVLWLLQTVAPLAAQPHAQPADGPFAAYLPFVATAAPSFALQVVNLSNQERAKHGCQPFNVSPQLSAAAQAHSEDMAINNIFGHLGSNGSEPWDRMAAAGYSFRLAAENVAVGYSTPAEVVGVWLSDDNHRRNILNCALHDIGVGFYDQPDDQGNVRDESGGIGGPYRYYWTQDFGAP
jgi:uncharacterized protein YkwD